MRLFGMQSRFFVGRNKTGTRPLDDTQERERTKSRREVSCVVFILRNPLKHDTTYTQYKTRGGGTVNELPHYIYTLSIQLPPVLWIVELIKLQIFCQAMWSVIGVYYSVGEILDVCMVP